MFSAFLTLWPKKLKTQLLQANMSCPYFPSIPNFTKSFQINGKDQKKKVFTFNLYPISRYCFHNKIQPPRF